jgi:hypothetical protein
VAQRARTDKTLLKFFAALATPLDETRLYLDLILLDFFPETTRELEAWEYQFGLPAEGSENNGRLAVDASWKA